MSNMPTNSRYPSTTMELFFRGPPILGTEQASEYKAMVELMSTKVVPQDEFEEFWINDYVHHCLQIRRWRRAEVAIIEILRKDALRTILASIVECDADDRNDVIEGHVTNWFKGGRAGSRFWRFWPPMTSTRGMSPRRRWRCACRSSIRSSG